MTPPSELTSTRSIAPHPDQARPVSTCLPTSTIRLRVRKSGNPGGTSNARGAIRVTGSPSSSGC